MGKGVRGGGKGKKREGKKGGKCRADSSSGNHVYTSQNTSAIHKQFHPSSTPTKQFPVHEVENPQNHGLFDQKLDFLSNILAEISTSSQPTNQPREVFDGER